MEICLVIFFIGLVGAIIKALWDFIVNHWRSVAALLVLAIMAVVVIAMIPVVKEEREKAARRAELAKIEERRLLRIKEEEQARAREKQEAVRRAEEERQAELRRIRDREDRIRTFALNESPDLWQGYQMLGGSIGVQTKKVEALKRDLLDFDRKPEDDEGYRKNERILAEMKAAHKAIRSKLEDAYLAYRAFEALPERGKDTAQGCIKEAEDMYNNYRRLMSSISENN